MSTTYYIANRKRKKECGEFKKFWEEEWFPEITDKLYQFCTGTNGEIVNKDLAAVSYTHLDVYKRQFHIFPPLVFLIAEIGPHTRNGKILPVAVQRGQPVVLAGDRCV